MIASGNLSRIVAVLSSATTFTAVFGTLGTGTTDEQLVRLRRQFKYLVKLVHPDLVQEADKSAATEAFKLLHRLHEQAVEAVRRGTYATSFSTSGTTSPSTPTPFIIRSGAGTYRLEPDACWVGDFSHSYRGLHLESGGNCVVKIAKHPTSNARLEREAAILDRFHGAKAVSVLRRLGPFIPHPRETFLVAGGDGRRFRALAIAETPGYRSVTDILKAFPSGLDPRDAAWIARRTLGQALTARLAGVIHGAIVPDHILVHPVTHDPLYLGWLHAVEPGQRIRIIIDCWRGYYPPEVWDKQTPDHRTDLYMAGKTMIALFNGDPQRNTLPRSLPTPIIDVITSCVASSPSRRPSDGRAVLDGLTRAIRDAWGRAYRRLDMPT